MWARRQGFPTHSNGNTMAHSSSLGLFQLLSDESKAVMVKKEPRNILGPMVLLDDHYRMKGPLATLTTAPFCPVPVCWVPSKHPGAGKSFGSSGLGALP